MKFRINDIEFLKRFINGKHVEPEEEEMVEKFALVGILKLYPDLNNKGMFAKLNHEYHEYINPTLKQKIKDMINGFLAYIGMKVSGCWK